jgi:hypothetical protein
MMGQAVKRAKDGSPLTENRIIPRPLPGGSYAMDSMGSWVDRLLGDRKARAVAAAALEPHLMQDGPPAWEPDPSEIPSPVPGGTERAY